MIVVPSNLKVIFSRYDKVQNEDKRKEQRANLIWNCLLVILLVVIIVILAILALKSNDEDTLKMR